MSEAVASQPPPAEPAKPEVESEQPAAAPLVPVSEDVQMTDVTEIASDSTPAANGTKVDESKEPTTDTANANADKTVDADADKKS